MGGGNDSKLVTDNSSFHFNFAARKVRKKEKRKPYQYNPLKELLHAITVFLFQNFTPWLLTTSSCATTAKACTLALAQSQMWWHFESRNHADKELHWLLFMSHETLHCAKWSDMDDCATRNPLHFAHSSENQLISLHRNQSQSTRLHMEYFLSRFRSWLESRAQHLSKLIPYTRIQLRLLKMLLAR